MPGDFREHFDIRKLDEQTRGCMEFVLNSIAYEDYFKPYIAGILATMNQQWKNRSQERKDTYPDEFLAGGVTFGEGMLNFFETIIQETNMERVHTSMESMTNDMLYEIKRQRGLVKPIIGLNQQAEPEPYDQNEDF